MKKEYSKPYCENTEIDVADVILESFGANDPNDVEKLWPDTWI